MNDKFYNHAEQWIALKFSIFKSSSFIIAHGKIKHSEMNGSKHLPNVICCYFFHKHNFDLLMLFPGT
jgi:hypothetical protein